MDNIKNFKIALIILVVLLSSCGEKVILNKPPVTFKGDGTYVMGRPYTTRFIETISLYKGEVKFTMHYSGEQIYSVSLLDSDGHMIDLLVNQKVETSPFSEKKTTIIKTDGIYTLEITAMGEWQISVEQTKTN